MSTFLAILRKSANVGSRVEAASGGTEDTVISPVRVLMSETPSGPQTRSTPAISNLRRRLAGIIWLLDGCCTGPMFRV